MDFTHVDAEYEERMLAYEVDCNDGKGSPASCHAVAEYYGAILNNPIKALDIYKTNCDTFKFSQSCFTYAKYLFTGRGCEPDEENAMNYMKRACDGNYQAACYQYGAILYSSSNDEIRRRNKKSVLEGKSYNFNLSEVPLTEVENRMEEGVQLLGKSCLRGDANSCFLASGYYLDPDNKRREPKKAQNYLQNACQANSVQACYNLALLYHRGKRYRIIDTP